MNTTSSPSTSGAPLPSPASGASPVPATSRAPRQPAVAASGVTKVLGSGGAAVHALRGVDLDIEPGRITAIMGQSGSGKSTLLQVLAGLEPPTGGRVFLGDREISGLRDEELTRLRRTRMGFVFQSFNLLPALDVLENIRLPFLLTGDRVPRDTEDWIRHLVERLGLTSRTGHRPAQLSGGQQQRVAIARALATRPDVVFADEPTGSLDSASSHDVLALLRAAASEFGQTIVLVTHDPAAASTAHRIVRMSDGILVDDWTGGSAEQIAERMLEGVAR